MELGVWEERTVRVQNSACLLELVEETRGVQTVVAIPAELLDDAVDARHAHTVGVTIDPEDNTQGAGESRLDEKVNEGNNGNRNLGRTMSVSSTGRFT